MPEWASTNPRSSAILTVLEFMEAHSKAYILETQFSRIRLIYRNFWCDTCNAATLLRQYYHRNNP